MNRFSINEKLSSFKRDPVIDRAFVPTMGNLHRGHLELVKWALDHHDSVVVSLFVNPTQFAPGEDFSTYPKTLEDDFTCLEKLLGRYEGKSLVVLCPTTEEIYPDQDQMSVVPGKKARILEGALRPSHFAGVCQVVLKLLGIVGPGRLVMGQKDYQQTVIVDQMIRDFFIPTSLEVRPIERDSDGLALSSRNQYLTRDQREQALALPRHLAELADRLRLEGSDRFFKNWHEKRESLMERYPEFNYLEALDENLAPISLRSKHVVFLANFQLGQTRLLDNTIVDL